MALFTPTTFFGASGSAAPQDFTPSNLGTKLASWISSNAGSVSGGGGSNITSISDLGFNNGFSWNVGGGTGTSYATVRVDLCGSGYSGGLCYDGGSTGKVVIFDGDADYWSTSTTPSITDSSGNTCVVQLSYLTNADQQNDAFFSISGLRDFQVGSSSGNNSFTGVIDMDGLSSTSTLNWYSANGTTRVYVNRWNIWAFVFNKTGNQIYGRVNGYSLSNNATYSNSITTGVVRIAANRASNRRLQMNFAENLIIKDKPGTSTNTSIETLEKVEGYLAHIYNLTGQLNPSHPYVNTAPRTG